jgi:hypothetical protein
MSKGLNPAERRYVYLIDNRQQMEALLKEGYDVRFLPDQDSFNLAARGVDLKQQGARLLEMGRE